MRRKRRALAHRSEPERLGRLRSGLAGRQTRWRIAASACMMTFVAGVGRRHRKRGKEALRIVQTEEWRDLISRAENARPQSIQAHSYRNKRWETASKPVVLGCYDGRDYVVKGRNAGRAIVNEQIVGTLGTAIAAPVGEIQLIDIPAELVQSQPELSFLMPGLAHGSHLVPDCSERAWIANVDLPDNRDRFALLALLYGLVKANDHQLIYRTNCPELAYSVDHGHFFPNGPNWTVDSLKAEGPPVPDVQLVGQAKLLREELVSVADRLISLDHKGIARAVAVPPAEWGISVDERIALAEYLHRRAGQLRQSLQ